MEHHRVCGFGFGVWLVVALLVVVLAGCPPSTGWVRLYGGDSREYGEDIQQTSDGGYIIAGTTFSLGTNGDMYLLKIAYNGSLTWSYNFGGFDCDYGYRVVQCADGGYVMAGTTSSFGAGGEDACLVKVSSTGGYLWTQTYGTVDDDFAWGLAACADGGYILTGATPNGQDGTSDIYLVKTDENGIEDWSHGIDYGGEEQGFGVVETSNGFAITGQRIFISDSKEIDGPLPAFTACACLVRTDTSGNPKWMREYGDYAGGLDLCAASDGGFVVAGARDAWAIVSDEEDNAFAVKTDGNGNEEWTLVYDSPADICWFMSVQPTSDGGYIFAGREGAAALLLKADADGAEVWSRRHGGTGSLRSDGTGVVESVWGGYCMAGSQYDGSSGEWLVYCVKTDDHGNTRLPLRVSWPY